MMLGVVYWNEAIIIYRKMYTTENILRVQFSPSNKKTYNIKFLTIGKEIPFMWLKINFTACMQIANVLISCSKESGSCKLVICG